jgi:hypothetical protein
VTEESESFSLIYSLIAPATTYIWETKLDPKVGEKGYTVQRLYRKHPPFAAI